MTTYQPTKRVVTLAVVLALVLSLLTVAYADFGPKPSVRVNFENMGEELCYGTLLSARESTGPSSAWDGVPEHARHNGVDFAMPPGNPVYSTGDGVIEKVSFEFFGYGNQVIIDHGFGYKTRYAHLKTIGVVEGMKVKRGECIGESGNSGKSTGPHLHYEVIYRDSPVNPSNYYDLTISPEEYATMVQNTADMSEKLTLHPSHRNKVKPRS